MRKPELPIRARLYRKRGRCARIGGLEIEFVDYHYDRDTTMPMKNPPHPGRIVREECLQALGLSVTAGAKALGVSRQALNNLVNERAGISPEMAIRLAKAFGSTAQTWLRMQSNYDLAQALKSESKIRVRRYQRAKVAA
jgi:addiction module HigA family antidote